MTDRRCSKCQGPRDREGQRYCRACKRASDRDRDQRLKLAMQIVRKAGIVIPACASDSGFAIVPAERMDGKREIGQTND
jgi:hypothetical protein